MHKCTNIYPLNPCKYDEFGEYLESDTSKKLLEYYFFEQTLCLKMPVHA